MKTYDKWVLKHIEDKTNKNIIITGGTGGIAYHIIRYLLMLNANIIMGVRNLEKGNKLKNDLLVLFPSANIFVFYLDLSKYETIKPFVNNCLEFGKIDYLINNAGIYHLKPYDNSYGMEIHFATNFYGPYLLTEMLKDKIKETNGKIVSIGSVAYHFAKIDFNDIYAKNEKNRTKIYGKTKKLLMGYSELIKGRKSVRVDSISPGITASTLFDTKHGAFSSFFGKIIVPIMHVIFMKPSKACLSVMLALDNDLKENEWFSPRGLFRVFGYPAKAKYKKNSFNKEFLNNLDSYLESMKGSAFVE